MQAVQLLSIVGIGVSAVTHSRTDPKTALQWRASMVYKNPGEGLTQTKYSDPDYVDSLGYNIMVKADGRPPSNAITWDSFDPTIFPNGSAGREWVLNLASTIDQEIKDIHSTRMKALYWNDFFVLPETLVAQYEKEIVNADGEWSFDSPQMINITTYMLDAVFTRFPDLDGLVIRTGEVYTQDTPYHLGAQPITNGYLSHIQLLKILEEVVIQKHKKLVLYRTWSFDGFVSDPTYYLNVTNPFEPNPLLNFVIKHTAADFWRTVPFNPTLNIGKHGFLVEIECQREYEAKGATPDYIGNGVIDGFEEYANSTGPKGIKDFVGSPLFKGIYTWPRGGGWLGPYVANEFWIDMNVHVFANWALNPHIPEAVVFNQYAKKLSLDAPSRKALRELALLSAHGVLLGHYSLLHELSSLLWTRDWYIGGSDSQLTIDFKTFIAAGQVDAALQEKEEARQTWERIGTVAKGINVRDSGLREFVNYSIEYGQLLYGLFRTSWTATLKGMAGNSTGNYDITTIQTAIQEYDSLLAKFYALKDLNTTGQISSLYTPFQFGSTSGPSTTLGSNHSVDTWRWVL